MKKLYFYILLSLVPSLRAQKEANNWYFGKNAGLTFNTAPPSALSGGMIYTSEGCSSASDATGNLLFYTAGDTVYDKNHNVMQNGTGLMGHYSTTQSALIIKQPGNPNIFYIFTQKYQKFIEGYRYSIVDMNLNGGLGAITMKNVLIHTPSDEKLCAVKHCNGVDIWILTHDASSTSSTIRANLLTATGLNTTAVISSVGQIDNGYGIGCMKVSPTGKKLAIAYTYLTPSFELYDFDNATGIVSNPVNLGLLVYGFGVEFSPDGSKLYGTANVNNFSTQLDYLYQWNLCATSTAAIVNSIYTVSIFNPGTTFGMQLGPDGKIYVDNAGSKKLNVINNPNNQGAMCNFVDSIQYVGPGKITYCLPNFISTQFKQLPSLFSSTVSSNCTPTASFNIPSFPTVCLSAANPISSFLWDFGDPSTGPNNTSVLSNPQHTFSAPGNYIVKLILFSNCATDTLKKLITIHGKPQINVSGNFTICTGSSTTLTASGAPSYTWSNGPQSSSIVITPSVTANYSVIGSHSNHSCSDTTTFTVHVNPCTGLQDFLSSKSIFISPNPFSNHIKINTISPLFISIFDVKGERIFEKNIPEGEFKVDSGSWPNGIYYLKTGTVVHKLIKSE